MPLPNRGFLQNMLTDSVCREHANEPQEAFDKLIRAIESLLPSRKGRTQTEKAADLFSFAVDNDIVWCCYVSHQKTLSALATELEYYVGADNRQAAIKLHRFGSMFEEAVARGDRTVAIYQFALYILLLRNKRFHGDPAFSGQNIRLVQKMRPFLEMMRRHVEFLCDGQ